MTPAATRAEQSWVRLLQQPLCGAQVSWDKVTYRCDRPAGHLPASEHSVTLRWTTKP